MILNIMGPVIIDFVLFEFLNIYSYIHKPVFPEPRGIVGISL